MKKADGDKRYREQAAITWWLRVWALAWSAWGEETRLLRSCVTLGKFLTLSVTHILICKLEDGHNICVIGLF